MEPRLFIRSGIAASAIAHVSILVLMLVFAEVHPFGTVIAEPIKVDIVSLEEAAPKPDAPLRQQSKTPSDPSSAAEPPRSPPSPAAAAPQTAPQPAQAARPVSRPVPQPSSGQAATQLQPTVSPLPPAIAQEPDLAIKYRVRLGLPDNGPNGGFDTAAFKPVDIPIDDTAAFRRHLKKCSTLPQSIAPSDKISIKLRVTFMPDGTLSAEPILIEASASPKGPVLMQSAIVALKACQPYAMLPAEKYNEWRVLDLNFKPLDFTGG